MRGAEGRRKKDVKEKRRKTSRRKGEVNEGLVSDDTVRGLAPDSKISDHCLGLTGRRKGEGRGGRTELSSISRLGRFIA